MVESTISLRAIALCKNTRKSELSNIGNKARNLALLSEAGLPIPEAFALSFVLALKVAEGDAQALREAERVAFHIGYPLAIRSSANLEDLPSGAAPGLFESILDVNNQVELFQAIRQVVNSGQAPLVRAYCLAQHITRTPQVAIIIQKQVTNLRTSGVLYTRPPTMPDSQQALLEIPGQRPEWISRHGKIQLSERLPVSLLEIVELRTLAIQTESVLEKKAGLDIEWLWNNEGLWFVQARPILHGPMPCKSDHIEIQKLIAFSTLEPHLSWKMDATHNPLPLSLAQSQLVQAVTALSPQPMRVVGGYLYYAQVKKPDNALHTQENTRDQVGISIYSNLNALLNWSEKQSSQTLEEALAIYKKVFHCYVSQLTPLLPCQEGHENEGMNPLSKWILCAQQGLLSEKELLQRVAQVSPTWDVCVPTYGERPERVLYALRLKTKNNSKGKFSLLEQEESLRESDDLFFYRAQGLIRRALLLIAKQLNIPNDLVFYLPWKLLNRPNQKLEPQHLISAQKSKEENRKQAEIQMPLCFSNGNIFPSKVSPSSDLWKGIGTGDYIEGYIVKVERLEDIPRMFPEENSILLIPSLSPAIAIAAKGAMAVICKYGEHLGHGAAMARELGIPCIVGCAGAWRDLETGMQAAVHGTAGLIIRL